MLLLYRWGNRGPQEEQCQGWMTWDPCYGPLPGAGSGVRPVRLRKGQAWSWPWQALVSQGCFSGQCALRPPSPRTWRPS